ncbi:MAG: sugar ABC transporter ATP-binding protein, partial [Verrucomicrobiota bacterium]
GNLDVAANVFLGREPLMTPFKLINRKKIHADTEPYLKRLGLHVSSTTRVDQLSIAQQQMVEIAKALSLNARLIIMDEPTSSLTLSETERLLELVRELSKQGVSVIYISHRLGEIQSCADRVIVLRDGRNAGALSKEEITHDRLVNMMIGREIKNFYTQSNAVKTPGYFKVRNARSSRFPKKSVSFDAARGEILGFAGLVGAGRSELAKVIVGLDPSGSSELILGEEKISIHKARDAIQRGIYLVPENRRTEGLVVQMSVRENVTLPSLKNFTRLGWIQRKLERKTVEQQVTSLKVKTPGTEAMVMNLSGGNQQKIVLGKWLAMNPKVMILDEPTRGIDVGAKAEIYRLMRELAERNTVILMISSDMEEILHVSDRVAVMHEGEITGVLDRADCTEENIMQLAVGKKIATAKAAFC